MVHYKTAALQKTTLSDKKNTEELSLSETASRWPRWGCFLPRVVTVC